GVMLGLGAAAKLYPAFLLLPILLLCLRAGKLREGGRAVLATVVTWVVVNAPIAILYPSGWWEFFRLNTTRGADPDTVYNIISYFTGWQGFDPNLPPNTAPPVLNTVTLVLFVVCCL